MLATILTTLIPALIPVFSDGVRAGVNWLTGGAGAQPANATEAVSMMDANTRQLEALSRLDSVGTVSLWVNNIRALQRPVYGAMILAAWCVVVSQNSPADLTAQVTDLARSVIFYLFGDRTYMYLKKGR